MAWRSSLRLRLVPHWAVGSLTTIAGTGIFLINVPIGILSLMLTQRAVRDPAYLKELKQSKLRVDYVGIA